MTSWEAVTTFWVTLNAWVVAAGKPVLTARSVSPVPALLRVRPEKVATPLTAVAVTVPPSAAAPGLFASARVTVPANEVATPPEASSAVNVSPNGVPAVTDPGGCAVMTSCVAAAGATLNGPVTAAVSPPPLGLDRVPVVNLVD